MNPSYSEIRDPIEDRVDAFLRQARETLGDHIASCEERIAESPGKSVLIAFGAGYVARSLPLGAMISLPARLVLKIAPPLLLALGAAKAYEAVRCSFATPEEEEEDPMLDLFGSHAE